MLAKAILVYFQTLLIQLAPLLYSAAGVNLMYEIVIRVICSMQKQKNVIFQTMWNVKLIHLGDFQLLDLIIMELKSHMTCYNSMPLIG